MVVQDITGKKFNLLTVLSHQGKNRIGQSLWLCRCDCGTEKVVAAHHMKSGQVKSCSCLNVGEARRKASTIHGGVGTPEYTSYCAAKKRCNPKRTAEFPEHGGRGIKFRFKSFGAFIKEIGPRPEPKLDYSLDRIDNDGHYEPGNVKWATRKEQARNRRCDNCEMLKAQIVELEQRLREAERK